MRNLFIIPLAVGIIAVGAEKAAAESLDLTTILKDFNAVIYTNGSTPSDIEGAAVIGGNFSGATVFNNPTKSQTQPAGFGVLTVFGNTSGGPININNKGSAYVEGTHGAKINFNGGGVYLTDPGYTISDFEKPLNALSKSLSKLTATSVLPTTDNNEVIKATPGTNGIAVFDITAAELDAIPSYKISLNGAKTIIFNVDDVGGKTINFGANDETGTTGANDIIWNFYNATTVNLNTLIPGTVLAPLANVSNGNQIDGDLIAKSWTGNGELHDWAFDGPLPVSAVPEVSTWMMMLMGFAGVGFCAMRKAKKTAGILASA